MLNKIIRFSLNNPLWVLILSVIMVLVGSRTAAKMEVDVFPDLNAPTVVVMTEAKGMAPEEVERLVSFPVETAVNGATDVRRVRSSSTTGFSIVWVEFNWGTDIYKARQIISEKLSAVRDLLPPNVGNPTLGPQSSILGELMFVTLTSDTTSLRELRTMADWHIRPRLLATGGVAQVAVLGGEIKEYQILLDPLKMKHYGIGLNEVYAAVKEMNRNRAGGILYEYGNEYIIRGMISTHEIEKLSQSVIKRVDDVPLFLNAIAEVKIGNRTPKTGVASYNGKPSVVMTITKQPNTNTLELTKKLDVTLSELQKHLPSDVKMSTNVYRQSRFIESSINNVKKALLEGGIFVVIVLFIFLMNGRTTLISLVSIPMSLLTSFVVFKLMGLTINTMSLGGLCIAIGSLVDDAVVDVENVYKRLRENRQLPPEERHSAKEVIFAASSEVRMPILNSTLIIIAGFLPLFFLSGMEGRMLVPLGIAFIVSLCSSTVVALTLTPVLCNYLLGRDKREDAEGRTMEENFSVEQKEREPSVEQKEREPSVEQQESSVAAYKEKEPFVARKLKRCYSTALNGALRHRNTILGITAVLFIGALIVFSTLGHSFLPPFNEGSFTINLNTLPGISLEESDRIGRRAEEALLTIPEITAVGRKTGRAELDEHAFGVNSSEIEAPFVLGRRTKEELLADVRAKLQEIPGVNIEVGAPISHRIDAMLSGTRASIAIKLFGTDLNRMFSIGNRIKESIETVEGIADLNVEQQVERPELIIRPKREMLAKYGITLPEFGDMIDILLSGEAVSQVYEGNRVFDLTLRVKDEKRASMDEMRSLVIDADGVKIPLGNVADIVSSSGPNTINRENVSRKMVISANVSGRDLLGVVRDIQKKIEEGVTLPEGYHIAYGGQFESERAASRTLLIASILSIIVIFMLLFHQFKDVVQSFIILLNLPLALIGGVFAIRITGGVISIPAVIGFISLFGIATRNGMLLITRYNDLQREGYTPLDAVMKGSEDRLNPILMTAITSALALLPMVIGGSLPGNEIQSPMAKVILGGLTTSTLLNGFIIPIIYLFLHPKKSRETEESKESRKS